MPTCYIVLVPTVLPNMIPSSMTDGVNTHTRATYRNVRTALTVAVEFLVGVDQQESRQSSVTVVGARKEEERAPTSADRR